MDFKKEFVNRDVAIAVENYMDDTKLWWYYGIITNFDEYTGIITLFEENKRSMRNIHLNDVKEIRIKELR